jgi:hypothetical protein
LGHQLGLLNLGGAMFCFWRRTVYARLYKLHMAIGNDLMGSFSLALSAAMSI